MLAFAGILGYAQSTNPLNYSGRMYVEAIQKPRYVSYEDRYLGALPGGPGKAIY